MPKLGLSFGAEGIGLCRTEHMFFDAERIFSVRKMILAKTTEERVLAVKRNFTASRKRLL